MLSKAGLLNTTKKHQIIDIEGGQVRIREMSGTSRDAYDYHVSVVARTDWRNIRAKLVQLSIVDADDNLMFADDEVDKVGDLAGSILDKIFSACKKLNGLDEDLEENIKK